MSVEKQKQFEEFYRQNIDIKSILLISSSLYSYTYMKDNSNKMLFDLLKKFYDYLYDSLTKTKAFKDNYISLKEHYELFCSTNTVSHICPFCGINKMETVRDEKRAAFDHLFEKSRFPFISLHYLNLVPMCDECNEDYKKSKSIYSTGLGFHIFDKLNIETIAQSYKGLYFFPFEEGGSNSIEIIRISGTDVDLNIQNSLGKIIELKVWDDIFSIKKRSQNMILRDFMLWAEKVKNAHKSYNIPIKNILVFEIESLEDAISKKDLRENNIFKLSVYKYLYNNLELLDEYN